MKNIFNLNSTSTGLNAFSRASKGDSQDARKGSTLTKMAAVICTFSCFQGGQKDKEGLKCKAKRGKRCRCQLLFATSLVSKENNMLKKV